MHPHPTEPVVVKGYTIPSRFHTPPDQKTMLTLEESERNDLIAAKVNILRHARENKVAGEWIMMQFNIDNIVTNFAQMKLFTEMDRNVLKHVKKFVREIHEEPADTRPFPTSDTNVKTWAKKVINIIDEIIDVASATDSGAAVAPD